MICALALVGVGCGSDPGRGNSNGAANQPGRIAQSPAAQRAVARLPEGCKPPQVRTLFGRLLSAVDSSDRAAALRYIAPEPELNGFGIYLGPAPGGRQLEARTPPAVYDNLVRMREFGGRLSLLRADVKGPIRPGVGRPAGPFGRPATGPAADDPVAGVEFVLAAGSGSASGKGGINCATGRFYAVAMGVQRAFQKQQLCGGYVHLRDARNPVVCILQD